MSKKAIIYCRTACKELENENLALGQSEVCLNFAEASGDFEILGIIVDEGISGIDKKQNRLAKLLEILKAKDADALIVYDIYRISRCYQDYKNFKNLLDTAGIKLITATPNLYEINDRMVRLYENYKRKVAETKRKK